MPALTALRWYHYVAAGLALTLPTTALGLWREGYHPDDWLHAAGYTGRWMISEGRWFQDLVFRYLFGGQFHTGLQIFLALVLFLVIGWRLAGRLVDRAVQPVAALAILAVGINYPYLTEALSWQAHLATFPLALLMSLLAFELVASAAARGPSLRAGLEMLAAIQLLALTLATYQPFVLFGAIVPLLALLGWDRVALRQVLVLFAACVVAGVAAIALYAVEWRLVAAASGTPISADRFELTSLAGLVYKLGTLEIYLRNLLAGRLMEIPRAARLVLLATAAVAALLPMAAALLAAGGKGIHPARRAEIILRAGLALGLALAVVPLLFWYLLPSDYIPPRAVGYLGFWLATLTVAGAAQTRALPGAASLGRVVTGGAVLALILAAVLNAALASAIWRDRARLYQAELALADQIVAAVDRLEGDWSEIRLVGQPANPVYNFTWGSYLANNVFALGHPQKALFEVRYDPPLKVTGAYFSPRACPAFPDAGSVFLDGGIAWVCLGQTEAFADLTNCAALSDPRHGEVCLSGDYVVLRRPECVSPAEDISYLLSWRDPATGLGSDLGAVHAPSASKLSLEHFGEVHGGRCHYRMHTLPPGITGVSVTATTASGSVLFQQTVMIDR